MISSSAQEEAKRIYEKNMILDSAEEEARKLIAKEPVVQQSAAPLDNQTPVVQSIAQESVNQVATQTPVQPANPIQVAPVNKTETQGTSIPSYLQILDNNDRYGEITKRSNALLVKKSRIDNISSRVGNSFGKTTNKKKEILNTLKEELETGNYSFLQRNDNIEEMVPNTKTA